MKILKTIFIAVLTFAGTGSFAQTALDDYIAGFTYETRKEMKISSEQIVALLENDEVILVDIRFAEEQAAWQMDYALKMPLSTLPNVIRSCLKTSSLLQLARTKTGLLLPWFIFKAKATGQLT